MASMSTPKANEGNIAQENLTPEELAERQKAEQDELVKKMLNNSAFLNFLQKNPDSLDNSDNNDYLLKKIKIFEQIKEVRQEAKRYITGVSSPEFGSLVDDQLIDYLEDLAIKSPQEFVQFSNKIKDYLESVAKAKEIEGIYKQVATSLGINVNYDDLSNEGKRKYVNLVHEEIARLYSEEHTEQNTHQKSFLRFVPFTKSKADYKEYVAGKKKALQNIKEKADKLDWLAIQSSITEIEGINADLMKNQAFAHIRKEFQLKASEKVQEAVTAKDDNALVRYSHTLKKIKGPNSIMDESDCDRLVTMIHKYSKEFITQSTEDIVSQEGSTLATFERAIDSMRRKGVSMDLSVQDCNEQIVSVLKAKIEQLRNELKSDPANSQNRIKLILARRVLINIE